MKTAKMAYEEAQTEIKRQIKLLQATLKLHEAEFNKDTKNWGFVGDVNHVKSEIKDLKIDNTKLHWATKGNSSSL